MDSARFAKLARQSNADTRFLIEEEIGRGGMGVVLRAYDLDLRRAVAMKVIHRSEAGGTDGERDEQSDALARFFEEAQIAGQLDHPGVVPVHELGVDGDGRAYFTMQLVKGRDLQAIFELVDNGREGWTETRVLGVLLKVCEAMAYAHSKGVIHRDLKPGNVMVGRYGEVYVMDWGLARVVGEERAGELGGSQPAHEVSHVFTDREVERGRGPDSPLVTADGTAVGTPHYMSPEQAAGRLDQVGPQSDVFAVGAMTYRLIAGTTPYGASDAHASPFTVLHMVRRGPPRPLREVAPHVSPELEAICEKAMARDVAQRYADMGELAEDLRAYLEHRVVQAYETGAVAEFKKWVRRNKGMAASILAAVLVGLFGLVSTTVVQARANSRLARKNEDALAWAYRAGIRAADSALHEHDVTLATWPLEQTLPQRRGWEWEYLAGQVDQSRTTLFGHVAPVLAVALDATGERLVSYGRDEVARVWDVSTGRQLFHRAIPFGGYIRHQVAFTDDLATIVVPLVEDSGMVRIGLFDLARDVPPKILPGLGREAPFGLAVAPGGGRVAAGRNRIVEWDVATGAVVFSVELDEPVVALAYRPDGGAIAARTRGLAVRIFDTRTGAELVPPLRSPGTVGQALAFSPDGRELAAGALPSDVAIWSTETGELLQTLRGHTYRVSSVAWHPNGKQLVTASGDKTLRVFDRATGESTVLLGHVDEARATFSPDGTYIVSGSADRTIKVWDTPRVERWTPTQQKTGYFRLFGTRDGRHIAIRDQDQGFTMWDPVAGRALWKMTLDDGIYPWAAFSPGGERIAVTRAGGVIGLYATESGAELARFVGHRGPVFDLAFHPDGDRLASASADGTARIWSLASGAEEAVLERNGAAVRCVAFDDSGAQLVTGGDDGAVVFWDTHDWTVTRVLEDVGGSIWEARLLAGGRRLVTLDWQGVGRYAMTLWNLEGATAAPRALGVRGGWLRSRVVPTRDGTRFVLSDLKSASVPVFDALTGEELVALRGPVGANYGVIGFLGELGDRLEVYSDKGRIVVFDASGGRAAAQRIDATDAARQLVEALFREHSFLARVLAALAEDDTLAAPFRRAAQELALASGREEGSTLYQLERELLRTDLDPAACRANVERARDYLRTAADEDRARALLGGALYRTGRFEEGRAFLELARAGAGVEDAVVLGFLALTYRELGRQDAAAAALAELRALVRGARQPWYAAGQSLLGESETALGAE